MIECALIEVQELHTLLKSNSNIKILDGSFVLPNSSIDPHAEFKRNHIKGSQFFDVDAIADHTTDLPHMLPTETHFSEAVGKLGVSNEDMIVVYGQDGIVMGPARVWWMFRAFGHENVYVLNGGLPAWKAAKFRTCDTPSIPSASTFQAKLNSSLVSNMHDIKDNIDKAIIFDARPAARFNGDQPEPRAGLKSGHMPSSINIPAGSLVNSNGHLKTTDELKVLFDPYNISSKSTIITSCGSGITACVIALALFTLGITKASVYDGSWAEWANNKSKNKILSNQSN